MIYFMICIRMLHICTDKNIRGITSIRKCVWAPVYQEYSDVCLRAQISGFLIFTSVILIMGVFCRWCAWILSVLLRCRMKLQVLRNFSRLPSYRTIRHCIP